MTTLHDFSVTDIDGNERKLSDYRGKVCLLVNVASKCGLTPQYRGLQALYEELSPRGLEVLGFPCNQFGGQEPGTESEVKQFCETRFGVSFPLFAKLEVNGANRAPLYTWLTGEATEPDGPGDIAWNFAKFVVGKDGAVRARFAPPVAPDAKELRSAIESALAG